MESTTGIAAPGSDVQETTGRSRRLRGGAAAIALAVGSFFAASAADAGSPADEPVEAAVDSATTGATFVPVAPYRAFDSRGPRICSGQTGPFGPNDAVVIDLGIDQNDSCAPQIPTSGVVAVTYNLTVVNTVGGGFLSVAPVGEATGTTSAVNWTQTGQIVPNGGVVGLGSAFEISSCCIIVEVGPTGSTNFFVDITGYYVQ